MATQRQLLRDSLWCFDMCGLERSFSICIENYLYCWNCLIRWKGLYKGESERKKERERGWKTENLSFNALESIQTIGQVQQDKIWFHLFDWYEQKNYETFLMLIGGYLASVLLLFIFLLLLASACHFFQL